ncbi:shikimate kinase [Consotaella salsifontis]|uniref:Shikimate kinase n=1 Tax=Consotaella salsifontis TaxID=1365950 RepID=A0A1T4QN00_9HYPH|nr:shikimate kinase [Consotaella salsifontis]SKA04997.1 shikimate kinase [Consotaella salsifontis]
MGTLLSKPTTSENPEVDLIGARLGERSIALVGLMGAGKTSIGRRLARDLGLPFHDTDEEIEAVSRMTVTELFAAYGEPEFRALETRVVGRLAREGPSVIATGGGAFINEQTRELLHEASITVWLRAELDILMERVTRRSTRPLLKTPNPRATMQGLMEQRYPIYAQADITVESREAPRETIAREVALAVAAYLSGEVTK